jgi:hypothetical protein
MEARRRETDMFTLAEIELLIEGLGTLIAEYGDTAERTELLERLRWERIRRREEIDSMR